MATGTGVFTPLNADRTERLRFDATDVTVIRGDLDERKQGFKAIVEIQGEQYYVSGTDCDLPGCVCDAYIEPVNF